MSKIKNENLEAEMLEKELPEMPYIDDIEEIREDAAFLVKRILGGNKIDQNLYIEYDVKRGLRDAAGKGVLTGLTEISDVVAFRLENGYRIPADGSLYYQGINVYDLVKGMDGRRFGFEETMYLLLFGRLPNKEEFDAFLKVCGYFQDLSARFLRDVVMKGTNGNIMNALQRCVLTLYTYDVNPDGIAADNVLRQSLELINKIPLIAVYSYHSFLHFRKDQTLMICISKGCPVGPIRVVCRDWYIFAFGMAI